MELKAALQAEIKATASQLDTKLTQLKSDLNNMRRAIKDNEIKEFDQSINSCLDAMETSTNTNIMNVKEEFNVWKQKTQKISENTNSSISSLEKSLETSISMNTQELRESDQKLSARINALEVAIQAQSKKETGNTPSAKGPPGMRPASRSGPGYAPPNSKRSEYHPFYHDQEKGPD